MINDSPVFLLASERSGTNLLRKLITQHQDIYFGPSPAHFFSILYYKEPYYGDFSEDVNFKSLIKDSLDLCYIHFSPWSVKYNVEEIFEKYKLNNFPKRNSILLSHMLMTMYAQEHGYKSYFCKDNCLYDFVFEILSNLPNSKFIYLHRDPRDFAVSQYERTLQTDSLLRISSLWAYEQVKCISAYTSLKKEQIIKISYEEMIQNSEKILIGLCDFLDIKYKEEKKEVEIFTGTTEEWANLDKPIMKNNSKKYLKKFTKNQIEIVESIVNQQMKFLKYEFETEAKKMKFYKKLIEILVGEFKFRFRLKFSNKKQENELNIKRSEFISKLAVKWNKGI